MSYSRNPVNRIEIRHVRTIVAVVRDKHPRNSNRGATRPDPRVNDTRTRDVHNVIVKCYSVSVIT